MKRTLIFAAALSLGVGVWLATAGPAEAGYYHRWRPVTPVVDHARHMPGWDWRHIYPYSPYNYGRNPYNPIVVPYPYYVDPYPVYTPAPVTVPTPINNLPTVTGPIAYPPPGEALIRVQVPNTWAQVTFDGQNSFTSGTQRYFVTPYGNGPVTYDVGATWTSYGQPVQVHRYVTVLPGQTRIVNFGR